MLSLSADLVFPGVTTDEGKAVIPSGLSDPRALRDWGQGRIPGAAPAVCSAGQATLDLSMAVGAS